MYNTSILSVRTSRRHVVNWKDRSAFYAFLPTDNPSDMIVVIPILELLQRLEIGVDSNSREIDVAHQSMIVFHTLSHPHTTVILAKEAV